MKERKVWEFQELTDNSKVLGCLRVFSTKRDDENNIKCFKARLVAQGFKQRNGETFDEVYSPVINFGIIRFFFAILICLHKWLHLQLDVKFAYLHKPLKEKIFMKQLPGFEQNPNLVCRLQKALYGLHQSGR
ncbi:Retrovirus-related Pol polyprotein from transposon TNT 1-94 [Araneus ventricosus]|uniref:Retrovirus-related Pol polyprotein from transposon TNT 1-94 n=1 Tax=Araneus ventricosus TaxID=182803 RepID=A0A4Y2LG29_ARAVE|nr:Retrovirus-related Pol polyprotein from transposon TNT 1-94 [Araneus ventricosus]